MINLSIRALGWSTAAIVLGTTVTPVLALPIPTASGYQLAQLQQNNDRVRLNLTEAQQKKVDVIRANQRKQIAAILTPEQLTQFDKAIEAGQRPKQALRSLNLTEQQWDQIRAVSKTTRKEIEAVLTPEQRQLMQQRQ